MEQMKKQFIYVLRPIPRLLVEENWTAHEQAITGRHFNYLKKLLAEGILVLAGKTDGLDEKTFGIVIIEANSLEEATSMMNNDPGVKEGIMTSEIFPYTVALIK